VRAALPVEIPAEWLRDYCERWRIVELSLFGSVLREDFREGSDVDVLVRFAEDADWRLGDLDAMEEEFVRMVGRPVDLVEREAVEESPNYIRRRAILGSLETIYGAR
jgi:predicted nucleotidyltransferase